MKKYREHKKSIYLSQVLSKECRNAQIALGNMANGFWMNMYAPLGQTISTQKKKFSMMDGMARIGPCCTSLR